MHVIDAHRHFNHTDNNASFAALGAELIAHENTRLRLSESAGMSEREVVAHQPSADFDSTWGAGFLRPDVFVSSVYSTL